VTRAGVAPGPHEDRHHVALERDRPLDGRVLDRDRQGDGLPGVLDLQLAGAVGSRREDIVNKFDERRVGERELGVGGDVASNAVGERCLHDNRLPAAGGGELHVGRKNGERLNRSGRDMTTTTQRHDDGKTNDVTHA
jgi:hypothetical protein